EAALQIRFRSFPFLNFDGFRVVRESPIEIAQLMRTQSQITQRDGSEEIRTDLCETVFGPRQKWNRLVITELSNPAESEIVERNGLEVDVLLIFREFETGLKRCFALRRTI